jgi:hypothetical protein
MPIQVHFGYLTRTRVRTVGTGQITPPLRKFAVSMQPTKKPRFDEASCIPGEEVSHRDNHGDSYVSAYKRLCLVQDLEMD